MVMYIYLIIAAIIVTFVILLLTSTGPEIIQAQMQAPDVPIGAVIDWWCEGTCDIPEGFLIANGQTVNDPNSPLDGQTLPDLTSMFVRGVSSINQIGTTGGEATTHIIHQSPYHTHKLFENLDKTNNHYRYYVDAGGVFHSPILWDHGDGIGLEGSGFYPLGLPESGSSYNKLYTSGPLRGAPGPGDEIITAAPKQDYLTNIPPYYGLLKIVRVSQSDQSGVESALNLLQQQIDDLNDRIDGLSSSGTQDCSSAPSPGINYATCDLTGFDLSGSSLNGANLVNATLNNANLNSAELTGANAVGAKLSNADLTDTELYGADLYNAKLISTTLIGSKLNGASLVNANLAWSDLTNASILNADFTSAILTGVDLNNAVIFRSDFTYTNGHFTEFTNAWLIDTDITNSQYGDTDFTNSRHDTTDFTNSFLQRAKFVDSNLFRVDFTNSYLEFADFTNAISTETNFSNSYLKDTKFINSQLQFADFTNSNLQGADFTNSNLGSATGGPFVGCIGHPACV